MQNKSTCVLQYVLGSLNQQQWISDEPPEPNQQVVAVNYSKLLLLVLGAALPVWASDWITPHATALLIWQLRRGNNKQYQNKSLWSCNSFSNWARQALWGDHLWSGCNWHRSWTSLCSLHFLSQLCAEEHQVITLSALQTFSQICRCSTA